jgi:hypothetical protein
MRPRSAILIAAASLFIVSHYVPFGDVALYPLTLFTTWVHEMGHGLTALLVGGRFESLDIYRNAGGLAYAYAAHGWPDALVAAGGLLAPPIVGAAILAIVHGPRRSRILLAALALALAASMVIWVRTPVGIVAMAVVALTLGWAAWKLDGDYRVIVSQVLGVVLALDTLTRMVGYAFMKKVELEGKTELSDVGIIAENLGGSHIWYGLAITSIALGLLFLGGWWAWRRPAGPARPGLLRRSARTSSSLARRGSGTGAE